MKFNYLIYRFREIKLGPCKYEWVQKYLGQMLRECLNTMPCLKRPQIPLSPYTSNKRKYLSRWGMQRNFTQQAALFPFWSLHPLF